jgi:hypothetical protein
MPPFLMCTRESSHVSFFSHKLVRNWSSSSRFPRLKVGGIIEPVRDSEANHTAHPP